MQRATKTAIHLPIIPFGWFGGVLVALVITCSRLAVSGDNKKKRRTMNGNLIRKKQPPLFLYQTPLVARSPGDFSIAPTDREPGTGDRSCVVSLRWLLTLLCKCHLGHNTTLLSTSRRTVAIHQSEKKKLQRDEGLLVTDQLINCMIIVQ